MYLDLTETGFRQIYFTQKINNKQNTSREKAMNVRKFTWRSQWKTRKSNALRRKSLKTFEENEKVELRGA